MYVEANIPMNTEPRKDAEDICESMGWIRPHC